MDRYDVDRMAWRAVWEASLPPEGTAAWRTPWVDESQRDGNPLFSASSSLHKRALRILQHEETQEVSWWPDSFARGEPHELHELVLSVPMGIEIAEDALIRRLITRWVADGVIENLSYPDEPLLAAA